MSKEVNWQEECLKKGFEYVREPDDHYVVAAPAEMVALLRDLLGVDVRTKDGDSYGFAVCELQEQIDGLVNTLHAQQAERDAILAERDRLREDRDSQQRVCIAEMEKVSQLRSEVEALKKDAEREAAASNAVISYMLGEGFMEEPMEFLRCWNEGNFDSLREEWPEAPIAIYYADPLADHEAIDAALQGAQP